jgi:hypothetical protein
MDKLILWGMLAIVIIVFAIGALAKGSNTDL